MIIIFHQNGHLLVCYPMLLNKNRTLLFRTNLLEPSRITNSSGIEFRSFFQTLLKVLYFLTFNYKCKVSDFSL